MRLVFLTNYVNHHQIPLADAFFSILGHDYAYVAMHKMPESFTQTGYPSIERDYILRPYESEATKADLPTLVYNADIVIAGAVSPKLLVRRIKEGKLTFNYNERWFKDGMGVFKRPWVLWYYLFYHTRFRKKNLYMLCASFYTASDTRKMLAYPNKCFQWGYFPNIGNGHKLDYKSCKERCIVKIISIARFIAWKHHEYQLFAAKYLKDKGLNFHLQLYGTGPTLESMKSLAKQLDVMDCVSFMGNTTNDTIMQELAESDIFLFTSDRNEGWGVVVSEAMSCGCAVIASDQAGATKALIKHGQNGLIFESGNQNQLNECLEKLLSDRDEIEKLGANARETMLKMWNPEVAAKRFLKLAETIEAGGKYKTLYEDGPGRFINN